MFLTDPCSLYLYFFVSGCDTMLLAHLFCGSLYQVVTKSLSLIHVMLPCIRLLHNVVNISVLCFIVSGCYIALLTDLCYASLYLVVR